MFGWRRLFILDPPVPATGAPHQSHTSPGVSSTVGTACVRLAPAPLELSSRHRSLESLIVSAYASENANRTLYILRIREGTILDAAFAFASNPEATRIPRTSLSSSATSPI